MGSGEFEQNDANRTDCRQTLAPASFSARNGRDGNIGQGRVKVRALHSRNLDRESRMSTDRITPSLLMVALAANVAIANVHLWHFEELYSNADGTLQFIEIDTASIGQQVFKTGGNDSRFISKTAQGEVHDTWFFPSDLASYTLINGHRKVLIGTSTLAAAANVTPDFSAAPIGFLPTGFLLPEGGFIEFFSPIWGTIHDTSYPALLGGALSYDVQSATHDTNSPTNFANVTGFIPPPPLPLVGDYNGNNVVDMADYTIWRDTLGSTTDQRADANDDDMVDQLDYEAWRAAFGTAGGAAVAVPEPVGPLLALGAGTILVIRRAFRGSVAEWNTFFHPMATSTRCAKPRENSVVPTWRGQAWHKLGTNFKSALKKTGNYPRLRHPQRGKWQKLRVRLRLTATSLISLISKNGSDKAGFSSRKSPLCGKPVIKLIRFAAMARNG